MRGMGFIESLDDIRNTVLAVNKSTPVTVANVASVEVGYAPRLGIVGMNNRDEIVEGIVLMRKYGNTLKTLRGVESKVNELNSSGDLAAGYKVGALLRSHRAGRDHAAHGVGEPHHRDGAGFPGADLFPRQLAGSALIAAINIPLALCGAFILMRVGDTPANLISLGAIDFGIIIDSTVIVMENIHHHLALVPSAPGLTTGVSCARRRKSAVRCSFSTLIFVIAFLPLFTMRGVEGAIFSPMSQTYAYALGSRDPARGHADTGAGLVRVRAGPASACHNPVWEAISRFYHGIFVRVLRWPRL